MKCPNPNCNMNNKTDAKFCENCGGDLKTNLYVRDEKVKAKDAKKHTIFISHAETDKKIVADFCEMLDKILPHFDYEIFYSSGGSIGCGDDTHEKIHTNLNRANNIFCILTENSYNRPWVMYEIGYAKGRSSKKKLMPIAIGNDILSKTSGYPYSRLSIYKCDEKSLSSIMIQFLNNLIPHYCKDKEEKFRKSFAPHIKSFIKKIKNNS